MLPEGFWVGAGAMLIAFVAVSAAATWFLCRVLAYAANEPYPPAYGALENAHAVDDELAMVGVVVARADGVWLECETLTASGHTLKQRRRVA